MGNKISSLELRLSVASTAAIGFFAWGMVQKIQLDKARQNSKERAHPNGDFKNCVLTYFDIPGKGECIRLALNHGSIPFVDRRVNKEGFLATQKKTTFGQLPLLTLHAGTEEECNISQSAAILRYVGKACNLYPSDPAVAALVDSLVDFESDAFQGFRTIRYNYRFGLDVEGGTEDYFAKCRSKQNKEVIPANLLKLERVLQHSSTGWLADTSDPTIADFFWVPTLQSLVRKENPWTGNANCLDEYPLIQQLIAKFESLHSVQNYYSKNDSKGQKK